MCLQYIESSSSSEHYFLSRGRGGMHTGLKWRNLREEDHLKDPGIDGRILLKWIFKMFDGGL
jgi:hypothetical protein